jgi:hypothetical protein
MKHATCKAVWPKVSMKKLVVACVSVFVTLACAEVYFRLMAARRRAGFQKIMQYDSSLGWDSLPRCTVLRRERPMIFFVGDSFTQGTSWPERTLKLLPEYGGINFGVMGYGTWQEAVKVAPYLEGGRPDVLVLLFFAWNDPSDNCDKPEMYYDEHTLHRPYGMNDQCYRFHWWERLALYPNFYQRAEYFVVKRYVARHGMDVVMDWPVSIPAGAPCRYVPFYTKSPRSQRYVDRAWASTESALGSLALLCRMTHTRLIVIGLDNAFTVDQDVYNEVVTPLHDPSFDIHEPLRRMAVICHRNDIEFIDALPALRRLSKRYPKVYNASLTGHLTEAGYAEIAMLAAHAIDHE